MQQKPTLKPPQGQKRKLYDLRGILIPGSRKNLLSTKSRYMTTITPSFLDHFVVHLASKLLREVGLVERWLQGAVLSANASPPTDSAAATESSRPPRQLYWRSRLLLPEPPMPPAVTPTKDEELLGFVDLTFAISINTNKGHDPAETSASASPRLQLRVGYFWLSPSRQTARYIQTKPLTQTQLEDHAKSIGIDLFSGPPQAMAAMMAQAFHSIGGRTMTTQKNCPPPRPGEIAVPAAKNVTLVDDSTLYYPDVQEMGTLELYVESVSNLDTLGMNLLYFNLQKTNTNDYCYAPTPAVMGNSDEVLIDRRLQEYWDQLLLLSSMNDANIASTLDSGPALSIASNKTTGIKHVRNIGSNNPNKTYVAVTDGTKKRKKKGKLMYAEPSYR